MSERECLANNNWPLLLWPVGCLWPFSITFLGIFGRTKARRPRINALRSGFLLFGRTGRANAMAQWPNGQSLWLLVASSKRASGATAGAINALGKQAPIQRQSKGKQASEQTQSPAAILTGRPVIQHLGRLSAELPTDCQLAHNKKQ